MITIRPTFWRPSNVIKAVAISGFCLIPVVFLLGSPTTAMGPACLVFMALMVWLLMRPIRLEITENRGAGQTRMGARRLVRGRYSAARSARFTMPPRRFSFRGADGQPLMLSVHPYLGKEAVEPEWRPKISMRSACQVQPLPQLPRLFYGSPNLTVWRPQ